MFAKSSSRFELGLLFIALGFAVPTAANAISGDVVAASLTTLNTSPLWSDSGQSYHACNLVNITTSIIVAKIDLIDSSGNVLATSGTAKVTVNPGQSLETANFAVNYTGFARCRFAVPNPDYVRANLSVFHSVGAYFDTLAVSEAR